MAQGSSFVFKVQAWKKGFPQLWPLGGLSTWACWSCNQLAPFVAQLVELHLMRPAVRERACMYRTQGVISNKNRFFQGRKKGFPQMRPPFSPARNPLGMRVLLQGCLACKKTQPPRTLP